MKALTLIGVILIVSTLLSHAATYYVDFGAGADGNNGTSTGTAFKHCPGDTNATATAASTVLAPSDIVQFKGGVAYIVGMIDPKSGVSYDGNSAGGWGTGKAILTDNHANPGHFCFYQPSLLRTGITFASFTFTNIGGSASLPPDLGSPVAANPGIGIALDGGAADVFIHDCDFYNLGYSFNQKPMSANSISGQAIGFLGAIDNVTVSNCVFRGMNTGVAFVANPHTKNCLVTKCDFGGNIGTCVDNAAGAANATHDGVVVSYCRFHDTAGLSASQWTGYGEWVHTQSIFHRLDYSGCTSMNNAFFGNYFTLCGNGTACFNVTEGSSCQIYNNQIVGSGMTRSIYLINGPQVGGSSQIVDIFNNDIFEWFNTILQIDDSGTGRPVQTVNHKNNIYRLDTTDPSSAIILMAADYRTPTNTLSTRFVSDYNCYNSGNPNWFDTFGTPGLTEMRAHGLDAHSTTNAVLWANTAYAINGPTPELNDLHLTSGSSARATGVDLSALFNTDYSGAVRVLWDMGAYLFGGNLPGPQLFLGGNVILRGNVIIR